MLDVKSLGLKVGLEIHQQLETRKLFCSCPSLLRDDPPNFTIQRRLRAVAGEAGEIDIAAQAEQLRERTFVYEGYDDTTCLVELDEEPPHPINSDALFVVLQVAKLLQATIASEIQIMRKTIVNGSVVSGFQRTALVGMDGRLEGSFGTISIPTVLLEEDAAKDIVQEYNCVTYRLDRQGIPLIEISTGPDITTPLQCMEVAAYLGMVLRSTGKVKRGLGTIRQDLNISIAGGNRVEIKGAQDLKLLPLIVEYEAMRQKNLLSHAEKIKKITISPIVDVTSSFKGTSSKLISEALQKGGVILAVKIGEIKGFLAQELQPGRRLGTELSDYAKIYGGVGGIFHSDELPKYGISQDEVTTVSGALSCHQTDAFVLVADECERATRALKGVMHRLRLIPHGVPKEVRRANPDGTSTYMRPMPGAARLYPETDVRPVIPHHAKIPLPELWTEKAKRLVSLGLGNDLAQAIVSEGHADLLFDCVKSYSQLKPSFMAEVIVSAPKILFRKYNLSIHPTTEEYHLIFGALAKGDITKDAVIEILRAQGSMNERLALFSVLSDKELEAQIKVLIGKWKSISPNALCGQILEELKIKADVKKIMGLFQKIQKYK